MSKKVKVLSAAEGYDLAAKYYDEKEKYLNSFEQNKILPLLADIKDKNVLDVGAGTGRLSVLLAKNGAKVTALDLSPKMLELVKRKNAKIEIVVGEAENLPFKKETFDIVTAAFLIVHLKDPTRFFDEVYQVLKDGGIFVVTNINQKEAPLVKTDKEEIKIESFYHRPEKIREILESLAFKIEEEVFMKEKDAWVNQIILAKK